MNQNVIAGRFEIEDKIGSGGAGTVYAGLDHHTEQPIAIKHLEREFIEEDLSIVERFIREGEALRQLNHPNIVKMLAAVQENDQYYLIMELVEGGSLAEKLEQTPQLPIQKTVEIALDLADALTRAHRLNIIHRDLKPGNVLIALDGTPRLTDFGVARMGESSVTATGEIIGTLAYLSPEALDNSQPDPKTDIWAFGIMLYEMLAGQRPFRGNSHGALVRAILTHPLPELEALRPDAPAALIDLVNRMLVRDPSERIASVRQIGLELEAILHGESRPITPITQSRFAAHVTTTSNDTPKHNIPTQTTPIIGREAELQAITQLLAAPQIRLITILAPGGMGKTRLALEVASLFTPPLYSLPLQAEALGSGPHNTGFDRVFFVELAPIILADKIVSAIAEAVGYTFSQDERPPKQQLLDYLHHKHLLLILDNFEHLLAGTPLVSEILSAAPGVKILVTSRQCLNLSLETIFYLEGMDFPAWETPQDALEFSAVKLFMQSARRAQPGFELKTDELQYVARICQLVGGMPLGILLAAAWIGMLSPREIADEISRSLDFLATEQGDVPARQRSIRVEFEYSWNMLSDEERLIFMRIAVFRGGFTRQAVQAVTGASLKTLTALVNKSLLRRDPNSGRYTVHELLRQYAAEQLEQSGDANADEMRDSHSAYYLITLSECEAALKGQEQLATVAYLVSDIENVRAAWAWAVEQRHYARIERAWNPLWYFCEIRGWIWEGQLFFSHAAARLKPASDATDDERRVYACLRTAEGIFAYWNWDQEIAMSAASESEALLRQLNALLELAFLLRHGHLFYPIKMDIGNSARPQREEALAIYRQQNDVWNTAWAVLYLATSYATGKEGQDVKQAKRLSEESLGIFQKIGDPYGIAMALYTLGLTAVLSGEEETAQRYYEAALARRREIGSIRAIASALGNLSDLTIRTRKFGQGRVYAEESLALYREMGNPGGINFILQNIAEIAALQSQYAEAEAYHEEGLALAQKIHSPFWERLNLYGLAHLAFEQGRYLQARQRSQESYVFVQHLHNGDESDCLTLMGNIALAENRLYDAETYLQAAISISTAIEYPEAQLLSKRLLGQVCWKRGETKAALTLLETALALARTISWQKGNLIVTLALLAEVHTAERDLHTARHHIQEALSTAQARAFTQELLFTLAALVALLGAEGQTERAVEIGALVIHHQEGWQFSRDNASAYVENLRADLSEEAFKAAWERGKNADLESMVKQIRWDLEA